MPGGLDPQETATKANETTSRLGEKDLINHRPFGAE
jgi:hypothetical protein